MILLLDRQSYRRRRIREVRSQTGYNPEYDDKLIKYLSHKWSSTIKNDVRMIPGSRIATRTPILFPASIIILPSWPPPIEVIRWRKRVNEADMTCMWEMRRRHSSTIYPVCHMFCGPSRQYTVLSTFWKQLDLNLLNSSSSRRLKQCAVMMLWSSLMKSFQWSSCREYAVCTYAPHRQRSDHRRTTGRCYRTYESHVRAIRFFGINTYQILYY